MNSEPLVLVNTTDQICVITINRPRVINALNLETRDQLQQALDQFDEDPAARVAIITGAGGNFCVGQDLKALNSGAPVHRDRDWQLKSFNRRSTRKVVIAAIEGYALAGGFELALSCDLMVAAETARFGIPEVKHNLVAIGGGLIRLPRRIPYHAAMLLALTGDPVLATRVNEWGLLAEMCPEGKALETAIRLAERISKNGPSAVRATKEIIRRAHEFGPEETA